jgi:kynurenine formamidase
MQRFDRFLVLAFILSIGPAHASPPFVGEPDGSSVTGGEWIDLSHELSSDSVFWPTAEPFELKVDAKGVTEGGYYYSAYSFCTAEHGSTHIDAPVHFAEGRASVDEIPLSRLIGPARVIDVREGVSKSRDHAIGVADLLAWEAQHGPIPSGAIVLLRTGYSRFWPDAKRYLGTAERGQAGAANLHFPGLDPDAAAWLVARGVASVGIDTASIDPGPSRDFGSHVTLMKADVPAFENLAHLDALPAVGAYVVALPVKIRGGSGGPLRIVAWVPERNH